MSSMKLSSQKDWTSNLPIELSQYEKELFPEPPMKLSGPRKANLDWTFSERKNEQSEETKRYTREELARVLPTLKECKRTGRLLK